MVLVANLLCVSYASDVRISKSTSEGGARSMSMELIVAVPTSAACTQAQKAFTAASRRSGVDRVRILIFRRNGCGCHMPNVSVGGASSTTSFGTLLGSDDSPLGLLVLTGTASTMVTGRPSISSDRSLIGGGVGLQFGGVASSFPVCKRCRLPKKLRTAIVGGVAKVGVLHSVTQMSIGTARITGFGLSKIGTCHTGSRLRVVPSRAKIIEIALPDMPTKDSKGMGDVLCPMPARGLGRFSTRLCLPRTSSPAPSGQMDRTAYVIMRNCCRKDSRPNCCHVSFSPSGIRGTFKRMLHGRGCVFGVGGISNPK